MNDDQVIPSMEERGETPGMHEVPDTEAVNGMAPPAFDFMEPQMTLADYFQMFVVYAFMLGAFLTMVFVIWGGINFIISSGKDEKVQKAIQTIRHSFIGLFIIIFSFTAVQIIGQLFELNFLGKISFRQVLIEVNRLIDKTKKSEKEPSTRPTSESMTDRPVPED